MRGVSPLQRQHACRAVRIRRLGHPGAMSSWARQRGLMAQAAKLSIRQGTESISLDLLDQAAAAGIFKIPAKMETDEVTA